MSKLICTASVFLMICTAIFGLFYFQVPNYCWCVGDHKVWFTGDTVAAFWWLCANVLWPLSFGGLGLLIVFSLWKLSDAICQQLRESVRAEAKHGE